MTINNHSLISMSYNENSNTVTYYFYQDGEIKYFQAKPFNNEDLKYLEYRNG
jgi:hypothetical protein